MSRRYRMLGSEGLGSYEIDWSDGQFVRVDGEAENFLAPGFIDIHIHGAFGVDFMSASEAENRTLCTKLREVGYEGFLPTTVTASAEDVLHAIEALPHDPMILGFHLEGPFISRKYPGAQPLDYIIDPNHISAEWTPILFDPRLKVITLAPERPGGLELTERLAKRGVRVSLGHSEADFAFCQVAQRAGVTQMTHTFNAMRGLHHREPGAVGFAMVTDDIDAELIYDRIHVSRPAAEVLVRCKPIDRIIAISDATMAAGLPAGKRLSMWGLECLVGDKQVRLLDGTLAGSAITLLDAFQNLFADFGPEVAVHACSLNPRRALGIQHTNVWVEFDSRMDFVGVRTP